MKKMMLLLAVFCATGLWAATTSAKAPQGLTLVFKATGQKGTATETRYFTREQMRTGDGHTDTLLHYASKKMVSINHKKKEYSEFTADQMAAVTRQLIKQMNEQMASMPPEARAVMEKVTGGNTKTTITQGGTRKIGGYPCQDRTFAMGQAITMTVCTTTALAFPDTHGEHRKFDAWTGAAAVLASNPVFKGMADMRDKITHLDGITLSESTTMTMMGRTMQSTREVVEIKQGPVPAAAFDVGVIAKGYKKVPFSLAVLSKE